MDAPQPSPRYEPLPRWGHSAVTLGDKLYIWGGRTEEFTDFSKQQLAQFLEVFDVATETWDQKTTTGTPPLGLYNNAHTILGNGLYVYGGWDGHSASNTLHKLDLTTLAWDEFTPSNPAEAPMKMSGCGMVAYGDHQLVLFGGFGIPSSEPSKAQLGSMFFRRNSISGEKGWTNELKVYNIEEGTWSCPSTTGTCPPPCVDFTFTLVDRHRAVVFGGYQPLTGTVAETYLLNMETWHWKKLDGSGPEARDGHTACLLEGQPRPQLLVSGGWDKDDKAINDAWILDVNAESWRKFDLPQELSPRFWHSIDAVNYSLRLRQLILFGGCPGIPEPGGTSWPKLADTLMLELGKVNTPSLPSGDDDDQPAEEWVLMDTVKSDQLGQPMRRLRERVCLAEYRAARAEEVAREALRKCQVTSFQPSPLPTPSFSETDMLTPTTVEEKPFWMVPRDEVEFTHEEIGKGRWGVVRVATYRSMRIAARCLYSQITSEDNREIFRECMDMASKVRHPNLLPFIGAVMEGEPIILTELMTTNLKSVLEKESLLKHQVLAIGIDVTRGLNFLHLTKPDPIAHGELTSSSVLLEHGSGARWKAKLSDFMTAKFFSNLMASDSPLDDAFISPMSPTRKAVPLALIGKRASRCIISPENEIPSPGLTSKRKVSVTSEPLDEGILSPKLDVRCFGILLIEMCTRTSPLGVSLTYLLESIKWSGIKIIDLIKDCLEPDPEKRPNMKEVLHKMIEFDTVVYAAKP